MLVNNAGGSPLYKSLKDITESYFDKVIGLNLKGPFRLSTLFASKMCEGYGGSIINVSTDGTLSHPVNAVVYAAAKSGLNSLTKSMAQAYGPKVRVNCILPGPFLTDIAKAWDLKMNQKGWRMGKPLMRAGRADETVGAALFFASSASSYCTGALLEVTGGPSVTGRDPYGMKGLDYNRDVLPLMRDPRLAKM